MHDITVYVDTDRLPEYVAGELSIGLTLAPVLFRPEVDVVSLRELWDDSRTLARPWAWEPLEFVRIEVQGGVATVKEIARRIVPAANLDVTRWAHGRADRYWAHTHSWQLALLVDLEWPGTREALPPLLRAVDRFDLRRQRRTLELLREQSTFDDQAKEKARRVFVDVMQRLIDDPSLAGVLDELKALRDTKAGGFADAARAAVTRLAGTSVGDNDKRLRDCAYYRFDRGDDGVAAASPGFKETERTALGFLTNLTGVMAPVPQTAQLAHVVQIPRGDVAAATAIVLVPLIALAMNGQPHAITRDDVVAAVAAAAAVGQPLVAHDIFTLSVPMSNGGPTIRVHGSLLQDPRAPAENPVHDRLWARSISLEQGVIARHIRDDIREGLDLYGPLVAAMEQFGLVDDPDRFFRLTLSAMFNRTVPGPVRVNDKLRRASVMRRVLTDLGRADGEIEYIGNLWDEALSKFSLDDFRRIVDSRVPGLHTTEGPRVLLAEVIDDTPQVRLRQHGGLLTLHVDAAPSSESTYELSGWAPMLGKMIQAGPALMPIVGEPQLALDLRAHEQKLDPERRAAIEAHLWTNRYKLARRDPQGHEHTVALFSLGVDEDALAPIRAVDAALADAETHAGLVIAVLDDCVAKWPEPAQKLWQDTRARLPEVVAKRASRAALVADRMHTRVLSVLSQADQLDAFRSEARDVWGDILARVGGRGWAPGYRMWDHADEFLARAIAARTGLSVTPLPFEVSLAIPLIDDDEYDDDATPAVDPLAKLAGAGVLLRRTADKAWRCLNAAALEIGGTAPVRNAVSLPIGYDEDVASVVVAYDGLPVAIRSPMTDEDAYVLVEANSGEAIQERAPAEYTLIDPEEAPAWARVPRLAYGQEYEVSGFFVHRCGALPPELTTAAAPWLLAVPAELPAHAPRDSKTYLRTTAIAAPRLTRAQGTAKIRGDLGTLIPADVYPLARDLPRMSVIEGGPARRLFMSGNRGTLDLSGGAWTLHLEGVEARGFDAQGYTLRVALHRDGDAAAPRPEDDMRPSLRIHRSGGELTVTLVTPGRTFDFPAVKLAGPASIRLRLSSSRLTGTFRAVLEVGPSDRHVLAETHDVTGDALGILFKSATCLEISATGAGAAGGAASVAFHVPRVDTDASGRAGAPLDEAPVVLMAPDGELENYDLKALLSALELRLRAPAVDVDAWERAFLVAPGVDDHVKLAGHLANVRAGWQIGLERNAEAEAAQVAPPIDLGLDDPHVTHLLVAAVPLHARTERRAVLAGPVTLKYLLGEKPFDIQSGALDDAVIRNLLSAGTREAVARKIVDTSDAMLQPLAPGETWELLVWPLVGGAAGGLSDPVRSLLVTARFGGTEYLVGPARRVILEVVTDELPSFEAMRAALTTAVVGRHIRVTLEPGALPVASKLDAGWAWHRNVFAYLHDATVERQRWRWSGRPMHDYPFTEMNTLPPPDLVPYEAADYAMYKDAEVRRLAAVLAWEVEGFGDRDQADYLTTSHVIRPFDVTDLRDEDLTGDDRAQHWRFRIKARSRYAGVLRGQRRGGVAAVAVAGEQAGTDPRSLVPRARPRSASADDQAAGGPRGAAADAGRNGRPGRDAAAAAGRPRRPLVRHRRPRREIRRGGRGEAGPPGRR